jgi:hypothetical protein
MVAKLIRTVLKISLNLQPYLFQMLKYFSPILFLVSFAVTGQSAFLPIDQNIYHLIDRFEIKNKYLSNTFHSNVRPYEGFKLSDFLQNLQTDSLDLSPTDSSNLLYLRRLYWERDSMELMAAKKPLLKHFFKQPTDFYAVKNDEFNIHISPAFAFYGGSEQLNGQWERQFVNTRGVVLRGAIGKKLGFFSSFSENQASSPSYLKEFHRATNGFPYSGFTKIIGDNSSKLGRDYMQAIGYLAYTPVKNVTFMMGHTKNFIGSGVRSLILSDFSAPYFNFATQVKLGRLEYVNILGKMNNNQEDFSADNTVTIPSKFMVFHHLNANITKRLNIGLFETVYFGNRKFDMNYLNPVIFYRFVEGMVGSSDNAIVGIDFRLNLFDYLGFYGQFILDEFNNTENKTQGWHGQKNALQLGMKYIDVFKLNNVDFQFEFNQVRPYTFSHYTTYTNAVNYNTPVGHPLGANFREFISILRYQPFPKVFLKATYMYNIKGFDGPSENWGGDIMKSYRIDRVRDTGNRIAQGIPGVTHLLRLDASYLLYQNMFVDLRYQNRNHSLDNSPHSRSNLLTIGIRWNINQESYLF